jgi:hypothetical protein
LDKTDSVSSNVNFPVLADRREQVFGSFGMSRDQVSTIVLRRNHHAAGIFNGDRESQFESALTLLRCLGWERKPSLMPIHPPVLLIPEAFSREDCVHLIDIFNTKGQVFLDPQPAVDLNKGSDYKMRIPEHMREDRIDHFFFEKGTVEFRFPEFGDQRYRPDTGTAIVFSSSLLHEAMHVTAGRRFVFLAFLFGDV